MNFGNVITEILAAQGEVLKKETNCGNAIAKIGKGKKIYGNCSNAIAENGRGKKKKIVVAEIWGGIKNKMLHPQYFYNIFTPNHK